MWRRVSDPSRLSKARLDFRFFSMLSQEIIVAHIISSTSFCSGGTDGRIA